MRIKKRFGLVDFTEELVILPVIAVAHIGLTRHTHLAQRLPFAISARGDARIHRLVLQEMKAQVQAHASGVTIASHAIFRPRHARQRAPQTAILSDQIEMLQPCIPGLAARRTLHHVGENLPQQVRIEQMLHLRETGGAHSITANLLLDPIEFTHRTEPAHTLDHRIEQSKEKQ
jgi:hypothetical protein